MSKHTKFLATVASRGRLNDEDVPVLMDVADVLEKLEELFTDERQGYYGYDSDTGYYMGQAYLHVRDEVLGILGI